MKKYALVVAGGAGLRMGTALPKQFLLLQGSSVLWHAVTAFLTAYDDIKIIVVLPAEHLETGRSIISTLSNPQGVQVTAGGETRFQSVKNGLLLVPDNAVVFVHDGVRCLVTTELIRRCYEGTIQHGNAVPAIAATDTIRIETENGNEIIDRNKIRLIQTPQTFLSAMIKPAFEQKYSDAFTDEASVVEKMGVKINLVDGEDTNIKITRPVDLLIAENILREKSSRS